jgi:NADH:ubiquinone oxidoreductase subunit 4 (subunit M)
MTIFFAGLPGTIKFISEFYIFSSFLELSPFICIFLMLVANVIGLIGFSKVWFNLVFGSFNKYLKYLPMDLSYKEIYIAALNFLLLFFITYTPFFFY